MMEARQDLLRDIEAYISGETPSLLVMLRAPKIHGWTVGVSRRGKEFVLIVAGTVTRHPQHPDGESVGVPVAWFDRIRGGSGRIAASMRSASPAATRPTAGWEVNSS